MRTALKSWFLNSGGGSTPFDSPAPLRVSASNDSVTAWVTKIGQDSFNYYLYQSDGTTLINQDLANPSNTKTWSSGVNLGTQYVVKVESVKSGYANSNLLSAAVTTLLTPLHSWVFSGVPYNGTNAYGKTGAPNTNYQLAEIYSVKGTANTLTPTATPLSELQVQDLSIFQNVRSGISNLKQNKQYSVTSQINLTGQFTILLGNIGKNNLGATLTEIFTLAASPANDYIQINSGGVRVSIGGVNKTPLWPTTMHSYQQQNIAIKRDASNQISISNDGGATFSSTSAILSGTVSIDRFFRTSTTWYPQFISIFTSALSSSQCANEFAMMKQSDFAEISLPTSPTPKGVTFTNQLSGDYFINTDMIASVTGSSNYIPLLTWKDYSFIKLRKKNDATFYGADFMHIYRHSDGYLSDEIDLGYPSTTNNNHTTGSLSFEDGTIYHKVFDKHYDEGVPTNLITKRFGQNFNFVDAYTTLPRGNGIPSYYASFCQYAQVYQGLNYKVCFAQEWTTVGRFIVAFRSKDNWASIDKIRICDTGGTAGYWFYGIGCYREDGILDLTVNYFNITSGKCIVSARLFSADNGDNWYNLMYGYDSGNGAAHTQSVVNNNLPISVANLTTYYAAADASATIYGKYISWPVYDPTDGLHYAVALNGNADGYDLITSVAGVWTKQAIDILGKSLIFADLSSHNGTNNPVALRRGVTSFDFYFQQDLGSSIWKVIKLSTIDGGANCTDGGDVTNDATKNHDRIFVSKNVHYTGGATAYNGNKLLICTREQTGYSDCFIKDIT